MTRWFCKRTGHSSIEHVSINIVWKFKAENPIQEIRLSLQVNNNKVELR